MSRKKSLVHKINPTINALKNAMPSYDSSVHAEEQLNKFSKYSSTVKHRYNHLTKQLSHEDRAISDLEHYIEFSDNLDMYKCWLLVKNLRLRLRKRRDVKNEHQILQSIVDGILTDKNVNRVKNVGDTIEQYGYNPRELSVLFTE